MQNALSVRVAYSLCNDPAESHRYLIGVLRDPSTRGGSRAMHDSVNEGDVLQIGAEKPLRAGARGAAQPAAGRRHRRHPHPVQGRAPRDSRNRGVLTMSSLSPRPVPLSGLTGRADGDMILAIGNDGQFAKFCTLAGHPEWTNASRATRSASPTAAC